MLKKITPRPIQRKAAKAVVENAKLAKPQPLKTVLLNVGYGASLQDQPGRVLQSRGFKLALEEMGLTDKLITTSLVSDIEEKPKNRLGELKLGAEILGMVKRDDVKIPSQNNTYNFILNPKYQEEVKAMEDKIKNQLKNVQNVQDVQEITQEN